MSLPFVTRYVLGVAASGTVGASDTVDLGKRVDRLMLIVAAMWTLMEDQGISEHQLLTRIKAFDEGDSVLDRNMAPAAVPCTTCDAKVPLGMENCQFCGAAIADTDPFAAV